MYSIGTPGQTTDMASSEPERPESVEESPLPGLTDQMFDAASKVASQEETPATTRESSVTKSAKDKRDESIMDTNNSSIVSKRSVEKLYYANEPEYFRYFVSKFKRRSPLINRGYWLRMKAIDHTVTRFLAEQSAKRKVVINLGCG